MKKGFILALLMVAMVALVLPVSAKAPIIQSLPKVIIGDVETSGATKGILRFTEALSLQDDSAGGVINWNNDPSYTSEFLHAYLYQDAATTPNIKPYNATGLIDKVTASEYANMFSAFAMPAASADLTSMSAASFWLSLIDATVDAAVTDPFDDSPAAVGHSLTSTTGYQAQATLLLLAGVTSGTQIMTSSTDSVATLTVVSQSGVEDGTESAFAQEEAFAFEGGNNGWAFVSSTDFPVAASSTGSGTALNGKVIGFTIATKPTQVNYGSWESPVSVAAGGRSGMVYRASAHMVSTTAATSDASPGWRLGFRNPAFTHTGQVFWWPGLDGRTVQTAGENNAAYINNDFVGKMFWAVPLNLGDMGDGEGLGSLSFDFAGRGVVTDWRQYFVVFDCVANSGTGWGVPGAANLFLDSMTVEYFAKPAKKQTAGDGLYVSWGTPGANNPGGVGGKAFNHATEGWQNSTTVYAGYYSNASNVTVGANSMTFKVAGSTSGANPKGRFTSILPTLNGGFTGNPPLVKNHLLRFSMELVTADANRKKVPEYRMYHIGNYSDGTAISLRMMFWAEFWNFANEVGTGSGKNPDVLLTNQTVCPLAPAASGSAPSLVESYIYAHDVTSTGQSFVVSSVDAVDAWKYQTSTVWGVPDSNLVMSYASWEDLGADF